MVNKVTNCMVMQDANVTEFPYLTVFASGNLCILHLPLY